MKEFSKKNKKKKIIFFEIPLLIESNLMNFFDFIILVVAPRKNRLNRYLKSGGKKKCLTFWIKIKYLQSKKLNIVII